jgi:hypothetical protein
MAFSGFYHRFLLRFRFLVHSDFGRSLHLSLQHAPTVVSSNEVCGMQVWYAVAQVWYGITYSEGGVWNFVGSNYNNYYFVADYKVTPHWNWIIPATPKWTTKNPGKCDRCETEASGETQERGERITGTAGRLSPNPIAAISTLLWLGTGKSPFQTFQD